MNNTIKAIFLDLDGTLLNNSKKIGKEDIISLRKLGDLGITRIFATGRTYFSAMQVLDNTVDFDFLIFSSGAGIYDWKKQQTLFKSIIPKPKVVEIARKLIEMQTNFSIHFAIPENHKYHYFKSYHDKNSDFDYRNKINREICYKLNNLESLNNATQFLVITNDLADLQTVKNTFTDMQSIRASSPIDGKSIWIEIFNPDVSKSKGAEFLCKKLNISQKNTLSIGNDYNDIDLLDWTNISYVVENAPEDIKSEYSGCCSNQNNPLTNVCRQIGQNI